MFCAKERAWLHLFWAWLAQKASGWEVGERWEKEGEGGQKG